MNNLSKPLLVPNQSNAIPESELQVCHVKGGGVKPGRTTECVQQGLVQQHRLHCVHLQVADIHFEHLLRVYED